MAESFPPIPIPVDLWTDNWTDADREQARKLQGPIWVVGASGFIGAKLFFSLSRLRPDVFAVSRRLRERGWQVPAYTFPEHREDLAVLRVVCRNGFSLDLADLFFKDLLAAVDDLNTEAGATSMSGPAGFSH